MKKNRYPKISGGVDNHYKKRAILTALLLGAFFCWGSEIKAAPPIIKDDSAELNNIKIDGLEGNGYFDYVNKEIEVNGHKYEGFFNYGEKNYYDPTAIVNSLTLNNSQIKTKYNGAENAKLTGTLALKNNSQLNIGNDIFTVGEIRIQTNSYLIAKNIKAKKVYIATDKTGKIKANELNVTGNGIINNGYIDIAGTIKTDTSGLGNFGILKAKSIKILGKRKNGYIEYSDQVLGENVVINGTIDLKTPENATEKSKITGITAGTDSKDIINLKQMEDVISAIEIRGLNGSPNNIGFHAIMIATPDKPKYTDLKQDSDPKPEPSKPEPSNPDKPENILQKKFIEQINLIIPNMIEYQNGNNKIQTNNFTAIKKVNGGDIKTNSKDLINGSQLYAVQQSIAGFADRIKTNKSQLEALKSSINAKKTELSSIQKNLSTIKETKLNQDMSNLTTDGEAVIKSQVQKAIQKFQKDMDVSTVQANTQEAKVSGTMEAKPTESYEPSIMLADTPIEATNEPVNAVSAISKEDIAAKADLSQTKANLEKKATLDTMDISAYTKQLSKSLATGESAYHAIQKAKEDRLVQAKGNTLTVGANSTEAKIDASKKNWTGIIVDEKDAGSMANVGYVNQTLSMESSYNKLSLMKKDLEKDTNKGIAKAAAMAALKPIGNDEEDKVSFAIGYGHYKDGNAAAIGTFFRPNQDILIHLDITAGAGKPSMNTGVSFKVGKGSSYASMTQEELAAENAAMKNQAEKQAERIQTQKEKIEHLESVMQSIRF